MAARLHADLPFAPRRLPFFYGWVVVGASTAGILFSIPGQTMGVSVFTDPLLGATGLDRSWLSAAYMLGTLGSAALLPRAGVLLDRLGVRASAMIAAIALAAVLTVLAQVDRLATGLGGGPTVTFGLLAALFVGLRFSGQGVMTLASRTMLARWFDQRRGRATAVSGLFVALGFAYAPRLLHAWIERSGWRGAWLEMALVEVVAMGLLAFLLFREDPESCGLSLDGAAAAPAERPAEAATTRGQALRTRAFWVLTLALAFHGMVLTGITFHIVDLGAQQGLSEVAALDVFPPFAVVSTAAGAFLGWLTDRVAIRALVVTMLLSEAVGYAASAHLGHPLGFWLAALGLGLAGGHFSVLTAVGHPRFFGRRHLGAISGASMTAVVVGSALGPYALAVSRSGLGSYSPALYASAALPLALLLFTVAPLHRRDVPPGSGAR
ncbi:MAG: MFS transporter [Sandaracinaceae bacterium]